MTASALRSAVLGVGMERRLRRRVRRLGVRPGPADPTPVTDRDLADLPAPARRWFAASGAVGRPRDVSLLARWTGTFRLRPDGGWLPFEAWQYNTASTIARIWTMRMDVAGVVPMFGVDSYLHGQGRMRGKVLGLVPVADGAGPEFDAGELVTWLDDAVLLAPTMLLARAVRWSPVDDERFDVALTDAGRTVTARVTVDDRDRVADVATEDRWADLPGGPTRARWTTPVRGWTEIGDRLVPHGGGAVWHLSGGPYEYARATVDPATVRWNVAPG
ncbi:DUF6544 family protein [Blastococcus sp. SYSU D00669]